MHVALEPDLRRLATELGAQGAISAEAVQPVDETVGTAASLAGSLLEQLAEVQQIGHRPLAPRGRQHARRRIELVE